ncbi:cubilin-like [Haliotis cracherodii]|uniref:cubilin-like n=1 Tax=Haliotis cracherodii TaxID=6455 RepID=UPI0039E79D9A
MRISVFCSAVVCLLLFSRSDSCNVEIVTTRSPTNVSSPGYPYNNYPSQLNCWWRIDASNKDNSVIVRVLDSSIEQSTNCTYDSLSFYDGPDSTGTPLGRLCGRKLTTVMSSGRSIYIVFKTDGSDQLKGFLLEFSETTRCGGELTATPDETTFLSPGFPYQYVNNMMCTWNFTAENENDTIVMTFNEMDVETGEDCGYDSVSVYNDHTDDNEQLLGHVCGTTIPFLQSSKNKMRIDFKSDTATVGKGFSLKFKTVEAGVCNLTMLTDTTPLYFVSPGYPDAYDNDLECAWLIVAYGGKSVQLDVIDSEIEGNYPSCSNDSVTAYDVVNNDELGRFCGNKTPTYRSAGPMTVEFKTDDVIVDRGFRIKYMSVLTPVKCGPASLSALTEPQYLQSPGYPVSYANNEQCIWTMTAVASSYMVRIVVLDSILEGGQGCPFDFVKVYDGNDISSRVIAVWCNTMEPTLQSSGQAMTLEFHTDSSNTYKGFRLKYFQTTSQLSCGDDLSALSYDQYLTSPGYPMDYPPNKDCTWTISTDYTRIKINVIETDIEYSSTCTYDYVKVYDGQQSSLIGKFCGTQTPTFYSSGSFATIMFHSDSSQTGKGFKLAYTGGDDFRPCGSNDLTAYMSSSYLTSPNYPYNYPNNAGCSWSIDTGDSDLVVYVDVIASDVEFSYSCSYDYYEFFDGSVDTDTLLGKYCGSSLPTKHSSGQYMLIKFHSDGSNTGTGFKLSYQAKERDSFPDLDPVNIGAIIGGSIAGFVLIVIICVLIGAANKRNQRPTTTQVRENNIHSVSQGPYETTVAPATFQPPPPYAQVVNPPPYPQPVAASDRAPIVTQVRDWKGLKTFELGTFCGNSTPSYRSNDGAMTVSFTTDDVDVDKGFRIRYKSVNAPVTTVSPSPHPQCGSTALSAAPRDQYLQSPGYPVSYANNEQCVWTITAMSSTYYVRIVVLDSVLEGGSGCPYDFVKVFDGSSIHSRVLQVWCNIMEPTVQSTGQAMTLMFKSDTSNTYKGFRLKYFETNISPQCGPAALVATTAYQYLQSPGYPTAYQNNEQCVWTMTSSPNNIIQIIVEDSHLEGGTGCPYDFVKVFDGNSTASRMIRVWCGMTTPTVQSSGRYLTLVFKTDNSNTYKGFRLKYFETAASPSPVPQCGTSSLMAMTTDQYLESPGYPVAYPNNDQCVWTIRASSTGKAVKIVVQDLVLEGGSGCPYDSVKVYDGSGTSSRMIQVWCDTMTPTVQSSGLYLTLVFKTDNSNTYKGFRLKYFETAVGQCGTSDLTAQMSDQYLQSPGYPVAYPNNEQCVWRIMASTSSYFVKIVVLDSDLEGGSGCPYDSVKVYDGSSTSSRMIQVWCDTMTPTVQSSGLYLTLVFKTDNSNTYKGFRLKYFETAVGQCGTSDLTAQMSDQYLQSPGYPVAYPNNEQCVWTITASTSSYFVKIVVLDSVLEGGSGCPDDFVKVYDGSSTSSPMIRVWCDTTTPTVQSSGQDMTLMFKTDNSNTFKGFRLKYFEATGSCGGQLSALSYDQYLQSPGYPENYQNNMNCVWTITTTMSDIKIKVVNSDIEHSASCNYDYVTVYDGSSTDSTVLGTFCGTQKPTYVSSGTAVTIRFHSDNSNTFKGFRLSYTGGTFTPCGEENLVAYWSSSSDLTSPNYPSDYPNNADCSWTINTEDPDYVVNVDVIASDIEYSPSCSYDYYELFDGSDDTSTSLGRYCGSSLPTTHSSGQYMFIKFHSDNSNTGTGFKISYQAEDRDDFSDLDSPNIAAIVGGSIGGFAFIIIICSIIAAATKKKSRPTVNQIRNENIYSVSQGPYETTVAPATFQPPPPYSQVVSPPPYPQPVAASDRAPIVTQVPD